MSNDKIENFERMLSAGTDNALLRYTLGNEYFKEKRYDVAATHLAQAVTLDPKYSAAWKLYGKALVENGQAEAAADVYRQGIEVAEANGDKQAVKEMQVFLRRLERVAGNR